MKKYFLSLTGAALFAIVFTACSNNASTKTAVDAAHKDSGTKATAAIYTCKMHPEVTSNKPGKCPKCGMDLLKREDIAKDSIKERMKMDSAK